MCLAKEEIQSSLFSLCFSLSVFFTGGLKVTCEYMAQHEGVLCEEVLLLSETVEDACVKVKVHARVMGEVTCAVHIATLCSQPFVTFF